MPTEQEIDFILDEVRHYLNPDVQVRRGDVLAAWSGIRPLVCDPDSADTQSIVRNHRKFYFYYFILLYFIL